VLRSNTCCAWPTELVDEAFPTRPISETDAADRAKSELKLRGALVSAGVDGTSTSFTLDLASGMSQVLATTAGSVTSDYLSDDSGLS